jgi:hypothetical protein
MLLTSPVWLILLVPWAGLVVWLLSGRLEREEVPFLKLWQAQRPQLRDRERAWRNPPLAIAALLAAMLFAIAAASGPALSVHSSTPTSEISGVRIDALSVRAGKTTQAMVRLDNESYFGFAALTIRADSQTIHSGEIVLPPTHASRNYFFDIPAAKHDVEAILDFGQSKQHSRKVVRRDPWPVIESRGPLAAPLQRMIEVYRGNRPAGPNSKSVLIQPSSDPIAATEPSAIVLDDLTPQRQTAGGQLTLSDGPLTRFEDWTTILANSQIAPPPSGDWQPLIAVAGITTLAVRENPVRQVWIGFNSAQFAHRADFVVFWTAVFDWLGSASSIYEPLRVSSDENQPAAIAPQPAKSLTSQTLLISLILLCLSAATWKPTPFALRKPIKS